jgi:hypothetical protein
MHFVLYIILENTGLYKLTKGKTLSRGDDCLEVRNKLTLDNQTSC